MLKISAIKDFEESLKELGEKSDFFFWLFSIYIETHTQTRTIKIEDIKSVGMKKKFSAIEINIEVPSVT